MAVKELSDGNPDGTRLGQSATDKVSFFGATTVVQQSAITSNAGTASTVANQVNSILTALRNLGLVAS